MVNEPLVPSVPDVVVDEPVEVVPVPEEPVVVNEPLVPSVPDVVVVDGGGVEPVVVSVPVVSGDVVVVPVSLDEEVFVVVVDEPLVPSVPDVVVDEPPELLVPEVVPVVPVEVVAVVPEEEPEPFVSAPPVLLTGELLVDCD